ncbi:MAG: hypothetical protein IKJ01_10025 [Lachnospiraceae bacterium]|nr:hypothetical protein [Lachnospiraceae bacterium]
MQKWKHSIILGVTIIILVFFGILPTVIAQIEDNWTQNQVSYKDTKTVQFIPELEDIEKVFLLKTGIATKVSEDKTKLKSEDMKEIVESLLSVYLEQGFIIGTIEGVSIHRDSNIESTDILGINNSNMQSSTNLEKNPIKNTTIPITEKNNIENTEKVQESNEEVIPIGTLKNFSLKCEPFLYYSNTISNLSGFFWEIKLECWDDLGQYITLYLDDQTGKIMLLSYDCLETIYSKKVLKDYVMTIFTYYQDTMDWFEYERGYGEQQESSYSAETLTYTIGDIVYGEILIKFVVTQNGFRIFIE